MELIEIFDLEAEALAAAIQRHRGLGPFLRPGHPDRPPGELRAAYVRYLKVTADYVRHTVPMLRAAAEALRDGDAEDRAWSERFAHYAGDETDAGGDYGHHVWAENDLRALGVGPAVIGAPAHAAVDAYGRFFVDEARQHPWAILGAKGVLEHLSVRLSDALAAGVRASGVPGAGDAVTFLDHHGVLDIEHVRAGDASVAALHDAGKRQQVLAGAYVTGGSYRAFLRFCM